MGHLVPADQIELAQSIIGRRTLEADANTLHDRYEERLRSLLPRTPCWRRAETLVATE